MSLCCGRMSVPFRTTALSRSYCTVVSFRKHMLCCLRLRRFFTIRMASLRHDANEQLLLLLLYHLHFIERT